MLFWSVGARWWACFGNSPPRQFGVTSLILMCRCSRWFGCPATEKDQLHSSVNGSAASDQRPPTFIAAIIPSFTDSTSRWRFHPSCHSVRLSLATSTASLPVSGQVLSEPLLSAAPFHSINNLHLSCKDDILGDRPHIILVSRTENSYLPVRKKKH